MEEHDLKAERVEAKHTAHGGYFKYEAGLAADEQVSQSAESARAAAARTSSARAPTAAAARRDLDLDHDANEDAAAAAALDDNTEEAAAEVEEDHDGGKDGGVVYLGSGTVMSGAEYKGRAKEMERKVSICNGIYGPVGGEQDDQGSSGQEGVKSIQTSE